MKRLHLVRRSCQLAVLLFFIFLPWANLHDFHEAQGSLFSLEIFGIPFADPASAAQVAFSGALNWQTALIPYLVGASLSLLLAFLLGRVFCGWICPYGFFSELLHFLCVRANKSLGRKEQKIAWWSKCAWILVCLLLGALLVYPLISSLSMPGQISLWPMLYWFNLAGGAILGLVTVPACALLIEFLSAKRLWCIYLCPQSVFLGFFSWALPGFAPGLRIKWQPKKCNCGKKSPCESACTLNINPRQKDGPPRNICVMCGDCVQACGKHGEALDYSIKPLKKS